MRCSILALVNEVSIRRRPRLRAVQAACSRAVVFCQFQGRSSASRLAGWSGSCTSTLELGIDVGDLDRVLQAEAPDTVSSFLQRMGRTGRRVGQTANTTFFCELDEGVLQAIALVELAKAGWVELVTIDRRCWPVVIHQLLQRRWPRMASVPRRRGFNFRVRLIFEKSRKQNLIACWLGCFKSVRCASHLADWYSGR